MTTTERRVQRVRHELLIRHVTVSQITQPSPGFLSITFTGPQLAQFDSLSFDDHVKFLIPDGTGEMHRRDYTPRQFDTVNRTVTLEFALHASGVMSDWARQAKVGDAAVIGGPRGSMVIPTDYAWHLLVGDASALPAMHRRLEELPSHVQAIVIAHANAPEDRRAFSSPAQHTVQWVQTDDDLVNAVRALDLPESQGYAWCAGEASVMARLRDVLFEDKQLPRETVKVAAYWKAGTADHHETL